MLDYRIYMVRKKGQFPEDDSDLKPYQEWEAGKEHCDYNNFEKLSNRFNSLTVLQINN